MQLPLVEPREPRAPSKECRLSNIDLINVVKTRTSSKSVAQAHPSEPAGAVNTLAVSSREEMRTNVSPREEMRTNTPLREQKLREQCRSYVEEFGDATSSERVDTARSTGSQQGLSSTGFLSGGGRVSFSRRTARLKKSQDEPSAFDPVAILGSHPFFSKCSVEFLGRLHDHGGSRFDYCQIHEPNVYVAKEKDVGQSMWIVHRGQLELRKNNQRIATLNEHDCFGERSLLGLEPRYTSSLRTVTFSHLIEVSRTAFIEALLHFPIERRFFELTLRSYHKVKPRRRNMVRRASNQASMTAMTSGGSRTSSKLQAFVKKMDASKKVEAPASGLAQVNSLLEQRSGRVAQMISTTHSAPPAVRQSAPVAGSSDAGRRTSAHMRGRRQSVGTVEDEQFIEQVKKSLRTDSMHGFRLPNLAAAQGMTHDNEEGHADDNRLDIGLLPPLSVMTTLQKRMLQRQLEQRVQAKQRLRNAVRRLSVGLKVPSFSRQ